MKQRVDSLLAIAASTTVNPDSTKIILADVEQLAMQRGDSALLAKIWTRNGFTNYCTGRYPVAIDYYYKAKDYYLSKK